MNDDDEILCPLCGEEDCDCVVEEQDSVDDEC